MGMQLTEEQLGDIEEFAKLPGMTVRKIAISLGLDFLELVREIDMKGSAAHIYYYKGKLVADVEFKKKVKLLSNQGSGPAQTLLHKMNSDARFDELRDRYL